MRPWKLVGCAGGRYILIFLMLGLSRSVVADSTGITFYKDVEPILRRNCVECHRAGQFAPFALLNYADAARRAQQIALVTSKRFMPPWNADVGGVAFRDSRRLTDVQVAALRRWAESGAAEGKPLTRPVSVSESESWSWPDRAPDLVLTLRAPFPIAADGPDIYHRFVLPLNLPRDRWIRMAVF